eukprot:g18010.t1
MLNHGCSDSPTASKPHGEERSTTTNHDQGPDKHKKHHHYYIAIININSLVERVFSKSLHLNLRHPSAKIRESAFYKKSGIDCGYSNQVE